MYVVVLIIAAAHVIAAQVVLFGIILLYRTGFEPVRCVQQHNVLQMRDYCTAPNMAEYFNSYIPAPDS